MITTITPLRRVAVTLAMAGVTAFGAVAIAPAAFADDSTVVTQDATATVAPDVTAPDASVPDAAPAPAADPAPVVTPPAVVIGKDGKPVKAPKACTDKDQSDYAAKLAKANQQAAPLLKAAGQLRDGADALHAQAAKMTVSQARLASALAGVADLAASKLEAQAQSIIAKVGGIGCIVVQAPGDRF